MNETIKVIQNRSSLRQFSGDSISKANKEVIIESALRAPTAGNLMLYSILKIENKETLRILSETCDHQPFIKTADFALIFLVDYQRLYDYFSYNNYFSYCKEQGITPQFPDLSDLMLGSEDAMCAAQNSVIAAESLGIGSCYIGDIIEHYEVHKELFNLQALTFPLSMLVFGQYPSNYNRKLTPRSPSKYIVFNERYESLSKEALRECFSSREKSFVPANKFGAKNAAQYLYAMKVGSAFSLEMKRSVEVAFKDWMSYKENGLKRFKNTFNDITDL